jgi:hypothetical protein
MDRPSLNVVIVAKAPKALVMKLYLLRFAACLQLSTYQDSRKPKTNFGCSYLLRLNSGDNQTLFGE